MFWSWIRSLVANNSFVQQFTNHYYPHRSENVENAQGTPRMESSSNHSKNSPKDYSTANSNVSSSGTNRPGQPLSGHQTSNNANINASGKANSRIINANSPPVPATGNKRKQAQDENTANKLNKSTGNQFDSGSGACLDNLRKLLNLNNEDEDRQPDTFMLLAGRGRPTSKPAESFYQDWLVQYRNMQQRGKQKLDQVKESLHQLKEYKREGSLEQPDARKTNSTRKAPLIIAFESDSRGGQVSDGSKLIKNKFIDKSLIDFADPPWREQIREQQQIREQVFEQIIGQSGSSQFSNQFNSQLANQFNSQFSSQFNSQFASSTVQNQIAESEPTDKPTFNPNAFVVGTLPAGKANLSINSELMNQIKVSQAQSYHQQLNVCSGGTPVGSFRAQVKRSSYPSGLRTTALRIGPRLNRDKSRSRLVSLRRQLCCERTYLSLFCYCVFFLVFYHVPIKCSLCHPSNAFSTPCLGDGF